MQVSKVVEGEEGVNEHSFPSALKTERKVMNEM